MALEKLNQTVLESIAHQQELQERCDVVQRKICVINKKKKHCHWPIISSYNGH